MFKSMCLDDVEHRTRIIEKKKEINDKIWSILVPHNKKYDIFYDIRSYVSHQQDLADLVPDIREYCTYEDSADWIIELKNTIYKNTRVEHYRFINKQESLYLCIDNLKCRIFFSFSNLGTHCS